MHQYPTKSTPRPVHAHPGTLPAWNGTRLGRNESRPGSGGSGGWRERGRDGPHDRFNATRLADLLNGTLPDCNGTRLEDCLRNALNGKLAPAALPARSCVHRRFRGPPPDTCAWHTKAEEAEECTSIPRSQPRVLSMPTQVPCQPGTAPASAAMRAAPAPVALAAGGGVASGVVAARATAPGLLGTPARLALKITTARGLLAVPARLALMTTARGLLAMPARLGLRMTTARAPPGPPGPLTTHALLGLRAAARGVVAALVLPVLLAQSRASAAKLHAGL